MTLWIMPPAKPMIEREPAPEIRIDDVGAIEWIEGHVRLYLYAMEAAIEAHDEPATRVLKVKIFSPMRNVPGIIGAVAHCLRPWPDGIPPKGPPRLVR